MKTIDGRILVIEITGSYFSDTRDEQGGFEPDSGGCMSLVWEDGSQLSLFEQTILEEEAFDYCIENGLMPGYGEPDGNTSKPGNS